MLPPKAEKITHKFIVNDVELTDDYAWLRDKNWPNVQDEKILNYLKAENSYTENYFSDYEELKDKIFEELKGRIKLTDQSVPVKKDGYYYYTRMEEDKNYPIHCRKAVSLEAAEEIYLDVNELAKGKDFTKLSSIAISPDHKLAAYSVDYKGNEQYTIYVKNLENGELLEDKIDSTIGAISWHENFSGFFYTPVNENWRHDKVKYHKLGTSSDNDQLIMHETDILNQLTIHKSSSKKYFFIESSGHDSSEIYYFSMEDTEFEPKKLLSRKDKIFYDIDHADEYFFIRSNDKGPNYRLGIIPESNPDENVMEDYLPYDENAYLSSFDVTRNFLIANYKRKALPHVKIYKISDKQNKEASFPDEVYTAGGYSTNYEEDDIRINYSSLKRPDSTYNYNYERAELTLLKQQEIPSGFNPDLYEVKRLWAPRNGVKIPITIFYKKDKFKNDGSNPLYLYGYGSYGLSIPPSFRNSAVTYADRGFVYAIAHIRGGDDLGFEWYETAKFLNKKNTFEDFIEVARFLIKEKYSSEGNITIAGGSAGGMLMGYSINNAPELYKAAIAHVPFVDVMNTMLDETLPLTPGEFKEWGNPREKEYFDYILSYSPYDNVAELNYPNIFATAGISDPRVTYWEAAKWIAKIRDKNKSSDNVILLKTNMSAGHAGASGRFDYLKEAAEEITFIFSVY